MSEETWKRRKALDVEVPLRVRSKLIGPVLQGKQAEAVVHKIRELRNLDLGNGALERHVHNLDVQVPQADNLKGLPVAPEILLGDFVQLSSKVGLESRNRFALAILNHRQWR